MIAPAIHGPILAHDGSPVFHSEQLGWGSYGVQVQIGGQGPLVVLLHGLGGSGDYWQGTAQTLVRAGYRVVIPDLPGHRHSGLSEGQALSAPALGAALAQWLDEPAVLVGNSLGGWLSLWAYRYQPQWIRGLVLVAPAGLAGMLTRLPKFKLGAVPLAQQIAQSIFAQPQRLDPTLVARITAGLLQPAPALTRIEATGQLPPGLLADYRLPTLVVWGEQDQYIPVAWAATFRRHLPDNRTVILPDCGHAPQLEQPLLFEQELLQYLAGL